MGATTKVQVEIDKTQVDDWAKERINELEKQLALAEKREARAKKKIQVLESRENKVKDSLSKIQEFASELDYITDAVYKDYA